MCNVEKCKWVVYFTHLHIIMWSLTEVWFDFNMFFTLYISGYTFYFLLLKHEKAKTNTGLSHTVSLGDMFIHHMSASLTRLHQSWCICKPKVCGILFTDSAYYDGFCVSSNHIFKHQQTFCLKLRYVSRNKSFACFLVSVKCQSFPARLFM